ncbi:MAG: class I SAM-dependent methyltransferase [Xanthomonadales bacterium]|nr:class I SAM-dependent methyltransferase [Gammaproteobacteria bacterium]MBT8052408.1 class I SAM-dependent methyltransferase [Gammaproteobacteria bacterium]NND55707.1 class I SAM-dependent methyltransferase [Xanthomonadales bacterium]NNK52267.1 class I SAM-dependent methyltransferase [Xanthomonadales bacterium]
MERTSEIILRNAARLGSGALLLVNPPCDSLFSVLGGEGRRVKASTQDFGDFQRLQDDGADVTFDAVPLTHESPATVILFLPREKERLALMLHAISSSLPPAGTLWLAGENQAGIKSAGRHLKPYFQTVNKLDSARHCVLYEAVGPRKDKPFELTAYQAIWTTEFAGKSIEIVSLPGVFAHGRLDPGSLLLLQTLERLNPQGKILDFACGSGVIGCALLAVGAQAELTMLDVSAQAIESSRLSLERNALSGVLLASDGLSMVEGNYDWIISNPPFHRGVSNDLEIAANFFRCAGTLLNKNGRMVIVCNRHLPYTGWLRNHFEQVTLLDRNNKFMVIQAGQPRNIEE